MRIDNFHGQSSASICSRDKETHAMFVKRIFLLTLVLQLSISFICAASPIDKRELAEHQITRQRATEWSVVPSFKFDLLCFLNVLTGDAYYLTYYEEEYRKFASQLTPRARTALANLKRKLKDDNGNIISAFLCLHFSATEDETLDDMLWTLKHSEAMRGNLQRTIYYNRQSWRLLESVRGDLRTIFLFLKTVGFYAYWQHNILPKVQQRIREVELDLPKYDVVTEVETHLGYALPSNKITIFMLHYARPHGIKLTGTRFICDATYPLKIIVQNAVHEMMHPPYDLARDHELRDALDSLRADEFLMNKVEHHNPSFGYNSFESFIEENCVRALDQLIGERLKIAGDARRRWKAEDDGMHVFAAALYSRLKQENYPVRKEMFRDFLIRTIRSGKLRAGNIKATYDAFYDDSTL